MNFRWRLYLGWHAPMRMLILAGKRETDACILAVARRLAEFTVDDVLVELQSLPNPFETHNLAALGPRMKEVSRTMAYMTATDRFQRSRLRHKNGNLHRVWKSNMLAMGVGAR